MKRIVVISDLHCGHRVGLTPPEHNQKCDLSADHIEKKGERMRAKLWRFFAEQIKSLGKIDRLIVNGDAIDGKSERQGGRDVLFTDRVKQCEIAEDCIKFIGCKQIFMTFGTLSHVGKDEDWESIVARNVGAEAIEAEGHYCINGVYISAKHKISSSQNCSNLDRVRIRNLLWADRKQQPRANIIIRSHVHRCSCLSEPGSNCTALTTPALQGLGSIYGARECDGAPVDFGFVSIDVNDSGSFLIRYHIAPLSVQAATVREM